MTSHTTADKPAGIPKSRASRKELAGAKIVLLLIAILTKVVVITYMAAVLGAILTLLGLIVAIAVLLLLTFFGEWWAGLMLATLGLLGAIALNIDQEAMHKQYSGPGGLAHRTTDRFIAWIGTLKYFGSPLCLVEDPGGYKIKGHEIRGLIDGGPQRDGKTPLVKLEPGDILLRGFQGYLDGLLIGRTGGGDAIGKHFSHAALYVGELAEVDRDSAARELRTPAGDGRWRNADNSEKNAVRDNPEYFEPGRQMVIHAMAKGVFVEDILTFLRCDYLAVLRLQDGDGISRAHVINQVRAAALGKIGSCYDFDFDSKDYNRFSCSELVCHCLDKANVNAGLKPKMHSIFGIFHRKSTTPADIYNCAKKRAALKVVWMNGALIERAEKLQQPVAVDVTSAPAPVR